MFIFAYKNDTKYGVKMHDTEAFNVLRFDGFFAKAFPIEPIDVRIDTTALDYSDIPAISEKFKFDFSNAGYMRKGKVYTTTVNPVIEAPVSLGDILESDVPEKYFITGEKLEKWQYLKGAKKIERTSKSGHTYTFSEGPIAFPDYLDKPARTMLTSEGTTNRSTHVVLDPQSSNYRILTPVETERIQGFEDNWTAIMPETYEIFLHGECAGSTDGN